MAEYPPADAKIHVLRRERHCGGLTATALVAAAKLGARCAFAGTLGTDPASDFVLETFEKTGIDTRHAIRRNDAGPVISTIIVDERKGTRNIFASIERSRGAHPTLPARTVIESARVLFIDYFGMRGNLRAARIAREAGIAIVSDFERTRIRGMDQLVPLIDHPIFSLRAAAELTGKSKPSDALMKLWTKDRQTAVITCGSKGAWYMTGNEEDEEPRSIFFPAFKVKPVDTTGCGDVFHGAYAAALAKGIPAAERIRFASAAAALKATKHGGQAGTPSLLAVEKFLRKPGQSKA